MPTLIPPTESELCGSGGTPNKGAFREAQRKFILAYRNLFGGSGTPAGARVALGASTVGDAVFTAASAAAALKLLDAARPSFSAYQSVAQSIPNNVFTKLQFQTEEHDLSSAFVNDRFTPQVSGEYQISAGVSFGSALTQVACMVYKNGAEYRRGASGPTLGANANPLVYLNGTTDYLEVFVFQSSGSSQNTRALIAETYFSGVLVKAR